LGILPRKRELRRLWRRTDIVATLQATIDGRELLRPQRCEATLEQSMGHLVSTNGPGLLRSERLRRDGRLYAYSYRVPDRRMEIEPVAP
jgi:hypothetical protein